MRVNLDFPSRPGVEQPCFGEASSASAAKNAMSRALLRGRQPGSLAPFSLAHSPTITSFAPNTRCRYTLGKICTNIAVPEPTLAHHPQPRWLPRPIPLQPTHTLAGQTGNSTCRFLIITVNTSAESIQAQPALPRRRHATVGHGGGIQSERRTPIEQTIYR